MQHSTEVVQLQGGREAPWAGRRDWSPIAQAPDRYGVMAHTPDPSAYHYDAGGRVIVPRATRFGGSKAFDADRGAVVNIDPSDPVKGTGGLTVDMRSLDKSHLKEAVEAAGEDATMAWAIATQQQAAPMQPQQVMQPPPGYGFMVPHASVGGAQLQSPVYQPAEIRAAPTPSTPQGPAMSVPTFRAQTVPAPTPALPQMEQQAQFAPPQPQFAPPQSQYALPMAPQPTGVDPNAMMQMMMQMMGQFTQAVQGLRAPQPAPAYPVQQQGPPQVPPVPAYQQEYAHQARQEAVDEYDDEEEAPEPVRHAPPPPKRVEPSPGPSAVQNDVRLPFLTVSPTRPRMRVVFNLGKGGLHSKHFHFIAKRGSCLSLIYDDRYDGDRFVPAETEEGETITVKLPKRTVDGEEFPEETLEVCVPNFHQSIGCLDILNFIIVDRSGRVPSPREVEGDMD